MRILNGVLAALLLLFAAVQHNDPDGASWAAAYGLAALWCALAAARPGAMRRPWARAALGLSVLAALVGVAWFWPEAPGWWRGEVWWETETAREGMGVMIVALALLAPARVALRRATAPAARRGAPPRRAAPPPA